MKCMQTGTQLSLLFMALCINTLDIEGKTHKQKNAPAKAQDQSLAVQPTLQPNNLKPTDRPQLSSGEILSAIQRDLKNPAFQRDIFPYNLDYVRHFLKVGEQTQQSNEYAQNVLRLFSKVLKGCDYLNAYVFANLLKDMPDLLKSYFSGYKAESGSRLILASDLDMLERLERTVTHIVFNKFTQDFESCKRDPRQFLDDLSNRLLMATTQEVNMEQLRQMVIRFVEVGLSKVVWSPRDGIKTWECVKNISEHLAQLMEHNILMDLDDLDELFHSLTYRYRYFLNLHSDTLPLSFYQGLKKDITTNKIMLLELEGQEPFLQTKASCLLSTVLSHEAKKRSAMENEPLAV